MRYQQEIEACLAEAIGEQGLSETTFTRTLMSAAPAHDRLCQLVESDRLPALGITRTTDDLEAPAALAEDWRARLSDIVVLGTGGSSLGARTLYALCDRGYGPEDGGLRLHFLDNVDPDSLTALLGALDLPRTGLLAVSKSGSTAETLAQCLILLPAFEAALGRAELPHHVAVVTEPRESPLARLAAHYGLPRLDHHTEIGGRFAVFSVVGMLPALLAGLDVAALRTGGREVLDSVLAAGRVEDSAPALGAALAVGLLQDRGIDQSVLMTYEDRLACFGLWFRQLWAESLGKDGTGTTPIRATGTADHHSQLQLYLAGPRDKLFTLILPATEGAGPEMDRTLSDAVGGAPLGGRRLGDLLAAAARATAESLQNNGRPVRRIRLSRLDEAGLGALLMHFMLETVVAADLLGVNAFDQPAVEEGKRLARQYLSEAPA